MLEALVTAFRDLRAGRSAEGWEVERPGTVMSTAEAVAVATSLGLAAAYFPGGRTCSTLLPGHLLGVVRKDDPTDQARLLGYWDGAGPPPRRGRLGDCGAGSGTCGRTCGDDASRTSPGGSADRRRRLPAECRRSPDGPWSTRSPVAAGRT